MISFVAKHFEAKPLLKTDYNSRIKSHLVKFISVS